MRQRLGLAAALIRQPRLLVLDEPTNGLDPRGIREVRDLLLSLNATGTTVFLSSHLLSEVEQLCTRVGVLDRGRLVVQDDLSALQGPTGRTVVRVDDEVAARRVFGDVARADGDGRLLLDGVSVSDATARLVAAGLPVLEAVPERRTLEETVLGLTS
jgi:ABC-2 type transport system ATP-binding protein